MKVGILGAGNVGDSVAFVLAQNALAKEILLCDINEARAKSVAMDINDASSFLPQSCCCKAAKIDELASCDIIVVSTGKIVGNADRLAELEYNKTQMQNSIPKIMQAGFKGIFIVISNPCDIISYLVYKLSGLPFYKVIGTGTGLDSLRLNYALAKKLNVSVRSVNALVLGEHGDSQFGAFSASFVGSQRLSEYIKTAKIELDLDEVENAARQRGHEIYQGKKCTQYGIANTTARLIRVIKNDSDEIISASTLMQGEYGLDGLYLSTPCVIGASGVKYKLALELSGSEKQKLASSAKILKQKIEQFGI